MKGKSMPLNPILEKFMCQNEVAKKKLANKAILVEF